MTYPKAPQELIDQWYSNSLKADNACTYSDRRVFTDLAVCWSADAELRECTAWLVDQGLSGLAFLMSQARRPESAKQIAIKALEDARDKLDSWTYDRIHSVLELIDDK
jgi:hypothetical protein